MRPFSSAPSKRGVSLIELIVAAFIMGLISIVAFRIMVEGSQYMRINQMAIDAQRSGLAALSQIGSGLQTTRQDLVAVDASGVVFASPFKPDGSVDFDPTDNKLMWRTWVCYYYAAPELTRRERAIPTPSSAPGATPAPATFAGEPVVKMIGKDFSRFQVQSVSVTPPLWALDVTVGTMTDPGRYGIELHSEVSPRN